MNEQVSSLIELQKIDSSILSLNERIELLPKELKGSKTNLDEANAAYNKGKAKHEELSKKKKAKDSEIEEKQYVIDKLKGRSSEIKTNKEYEAHLKEIEASEKIKYDAEEEVLLAMEGIEEIEGGLKKNETRVKEAEDELKRLEKELEEEKNSLEQEMEKNRLMRNGLIEKIDSGIYSQYMSNLKRFGDLAIVPAENEICLGCNTNIPPQLFNDLKDNDKIIKCYYCKRFLYSKEK